MELTLRSPFLASLNLTNCPALNHIDLASSSLLVILITFALASFSRINLSKHKCENGTQPPLCLLEVNICIDVFDYCTNLSRHYWVAVLYLLLTETWPEKSIEFGKFGFALPLATSCRPLWLWISDRPGLQRFQRRRRLPKTEYAGSWQLWCTLPALFFDLVNPFYNLDWIVLDPIFFRSFLLFTYVITWVQYQSASVLIWFLIFWQEYGCTGLGESEALYCISWEALISGLQKGFDPWAVVHWAPAPSLGWVWPSDRCLFCSSWIIVFEPWHLPPSDKSGNQGRSDDSLGFAGLWTSFSSDHRLSKSFIFRRFILQVCDSPYEGLA